jgi:hypothetical protein
VNEWWRSFTELFKSAGERAVFLISGVAAVVVVVIEHIAPKKHIADGLWLWIVLAGIAVGMFLAFHRVRLERDQGSGEPAAPEHAEQLRNELRGLALALENERAWEPADEIRAHFADLMPALDEWNGRVRRVLAAREALTAALANEATQLGVTAAAGYERNFVLAQVGQLIIEAAARGQLDETPPSFQWAHVRDGTVMTSEIAHQQPPVVMIPDPGGKLVEAPELTRHITDPVDRLLSRGWTSAEARELGSAQSPLRDYRGAFRQSVVRRSRVERIRANPNCPVCRLNLAG